MRSIGSVRLLVAVACFLNLQGGLHRSGWGQEKQDDPDLKPSRDYVQAGDRLARAVVEGRADKIKRVVAADRKFVFRVMDEKIHLLIVEKGHHDDLKIFESMAGDDSRLLEAFESIREPTEAEKKQAKLLRSRLESVRKMTRGDAERYLDSMGTWSKAEDLREAGDLNGAEAVLKKHIQVMEEFGNPAAAARAHALLAKFYEDSGRFEESIREGEAAMETDRSIGVAFNESVALSILARLCSRLGRHEEAAKRIESALKIARESSDRSSERTVRHNAAFCSVRVGRLEEALTELEGALEIERELVWTYDVASTLGDIGWILLSLGRVEEADRRLGEGVERAEAMRRLFGMNEAEKAVMMAELRWIYDLALAAKFKKNDKEQAATLLESMRSRNLLDALGQGESLYRDVPKELLAARSAQMSKYNEKHRELQEMVQSLQGASGEERKKIQSRIDEAKKEIPKIEEDLAAIARQIRQHPTVRLKMKDPRPLDAKSIQGVLKEDEVLVMYNVVDAYESRSGKNGLQARETILVALFKRSSLEIFELNRGKDFLNDVRWFPRADKQSGKGYLAQEFKVRARRLYDVLVKPFERRLAGVRRLIVSPDEYLYGLPFDALIASDAGETYSEFDYLGKHHEILIMPSGTLLANARSGPRATGRRVVTFGDPEYPSMEAFHRLEIASPAGPGPAIPADLKKFENLEEATPQQWKRLPNSGEEAAEIAKLLGGESFLGKEASERNAKAIRDARIVHFACHAYISSIPSKSSLVLAADGQEDGYLQAREIADLEIKADLVVLSACESAQGAMLPGEGLIGLTRAFMMAGAHSVIASLWPVSDRGGKDFMIAFYRKMDAGKDKLTALFETKREFMKDKKYSAPFYWSGFVLHGE